MITGKRLAFEARCKERGYTLDEVKACIINENEDMITVDETHPSYPRESRRHLNTQQPLESINTNPKPLPPLWERVTNFVSSTAEHVAAGMPMCSQEQVEARYAICQGCEFFSNGSCSKCGCPLIREKKYISKLSWANEECPIGKWSKTIS